MNVTQALKTFGYSAAPRDAAQLSRDFAEKFNSLNLARNMATEGKTRAKYKRGIQVLNEAKAVLERDLSMNMCRVSPSQSNGFIPQILRTVKKITSRLYED